jgi:thiamine biosynthesis lipoprotein
MGTFAEVISPDKSAAKIVFDEIRRIEGLLSKYRKDSEISKLNQSGELKLSPETFYVLKRAADFNAASKGAFDITVAPLMDLWGFTDKKYNLPAEEQIRETLKLVGMDKIIFDETNNVVKFALPGIKIDLGGVAKGYALDCAVNQLKKHGIKSALVNAGGQVYCLGDKFGRPWRLGIKSPRAKGVAGYYLELKDKAAATSGDYEQYFIKGNKRYSHIMDPKTGYPVTSGIVSVTVIAPDSLTADALSTSIFVLGKEKGEELAKKFAGVKTEVIEE